MKKYVFLAFILIFGTSILSGSMTYQKTNQKNNETNPQTVAQNVENLISETSSDEQIVEEVNEEIISDELEEEIETPSVIEDKAEEKAKFILLKVSLTFLFLLSSTFTLSIFFEKLEEYTIGFEKLFSLSNLNLLKLEITFGFII